MGCIESCNPRILLAEDNPVNQKVAQMMLRHLGYSVDTVANGLEALETLENQSYDIILMDIQMPEMDGLEATRTIRRWLLTKDQPFIIAVTAYALDYSREMCLDAGMDDYIAKPVHKEDLAGMLETYGQLKGSVSL